MLVPLLERMFKKSAVDKEDIDLFSVGLGPGSFTGLRISLSVIKGLVLSLKKRVIGISSLDIIARNVEEDGKICVILDARRGNIYTASYEQKNFSLRRITPYSLTNFVDWSRQIRGKTFVLGDGLAVYGSKLPKQKNIVCLPEKFWYPDARNLCMLAFEKFKERGADNIEKLLPLYLYPKECQIKSG